MSSDGEGREAPSSIWLRPDRAARGPAPEYSRAQLAAAGVELADQGGLAAVSMRRVAAAVGTAPASLYRYVANRDELMLLMVDVVIGELELPEHPSGDWLADLVAVGRAQLALFRRHPWLLDQGGAVWAQLTPRLADFLEYTLAVMDGLDLAPATKLEAVAMLSGVVSLFARDELLRERGHTSPEGQQTTAAYLGQVAAQGRHPRLIGVLAAAAQDPRPADQGELFDRVVSGILSGLLRQT